MVEAHRTHWLSAHSPALDSIAADLIVAPAPLIDHAAPLIPEPPSASVDRGALEIYRAVLQMAWVDQYLDMQEINLLFKQARELNLTLEQTEAIDREVIGRSVREQAYFTALQATRDEHGDFSLRELQKLPAFMQQISISHEHAQAVELEVLGKSLIEALIFELQQQKESIPVVQDNHCIETNFTDYPLINERYCDLGDGTVLDTQTNLQWMRCALGQTWDGENCVGKAIRFNWDEANTAVKDHQQVNDNDWRLPSLEELATLIVEGEKPTIDSKVFPNTLAWFWSSSLDADNSSYVWGVNFHNGDINNNYRSGNSYVRLVRNRL